MKAIPELVDTITRREDILELILSELRSLRDAQERRDAWLDAKIEKLERELELVRIEQERQGKNLATLEASCSRRLTICSLKKPSGRPPSSPASESWTPIPEKEGA